MDNFEIGSCFKSYEELMEKLKDYCNYTHTKFTTKDCRLIKDEFAENTDAKVRLIYTDLKLICVHGRTMKARKEEMKRKRSEKNVKTGCPAYFRLKLIHSGVALQIVALNVKHNHPLEAKTDDNERVARHKKPRIAKEKSSKNLYVDIKSEDDLDSEDEENQALEFMEDYIDAEETDNHQLVKFTFKGLCAPVFTPFNADMSINTAILQKYAKYLLDNGILGILANSITGEGPSMTVSERKLLIESWVQVVQSTKQHIMVQVGGCPLPDVLELAKHAEQAGVGSLLCLPDMVYKPRSPIELIEYLKLVAQAAPKTPLLYDHAPAITGADVNMIEFLQESMDKLPTLCGIKFSSSDLNVGIEALRTSNGKYPIFIGVDTILASAFAVGFESAIVTNLNIFPQDVSGILNAVNNSNLHKAKELQYKLADLKALTKYGPEMVVMKAAMNLLTPIDVGPVRHPLKKLTIEQMNGIKSILNL